MVYHLWYGSPSSIRGTYLDSHRLPSGIVISYWITYGTASSENPSVQFRLPIILQCVFAIITIVLLLGLPETPRYLFKHDRSDRGRQILATIDGLEEDDPEISAQCAAIQMAIAEETEAGTSLWVALRNSGYHHTLRRLLLAMGLQMMQQLTGINAVIYYLFVLSYFPCPPA